jgi:hypothetical protein
VEDIFKVMRSPKKITNRKRVNQVEVKPLSWKIGGVMNNSMNPIKALAHRFVSLPPLARMKVSKRLLELYSSEQAGREVEQTGVSSSRTLRKSFLEQFWDEVEQAHGDHPEAVNPFTEERRWKKPKVKNTVEENEQGGYLPWRMRSSDLFALL